MQPTPEVSLIFRKCQGKKRSSGPPSREPCTLRELRGHGGAGVGEGGGGEGWGGGGQEGREE